MKKLNRLFLGAVAFAAASAFSLTGMAAQASTIYINSSSKWDTSKDLSVRPDGRVYNADGKLVGHLTDANGKSLKEIPASGDYEIQTRSGKILASSNATTPGVDSNRSMQISAGSEENSKGGLNNTPTTTTAVNNSANSANNNGGMASQQQASDKGAASQPNNSGSGTSGDTARIPATANTGSTMTASSPGSSSTGTTSSSQ